MQSIVKAVRTNCVTGEFNDVEVTVEKSRWPTDGSWWYKIVKGGVTGYESCHVESMRDRSRGWCACAGTKNRWDTLFIPAESVSQFVKELDDA